MASLIYTFLFCFSGVLILRFMLPEKSPLDRIWMGLCLGLLMEMWYPSLAAYAFRFSLKAHIAGKYPIFPVSAATGQGFDQLMDCVAQTLASLPPMEPFAEEEMLPEMLENTGFEVSKDGKVFVVSGSAVVQLLDSVNFDDEESLNWFHRTLRRAGIIDALRQAGAQEGSTVRIEDMEFDFVE